MILQPESVGASAQGIPRESGDDPYHERGGLHDSAYSPRERG